MNANFYWKVLLGIMTASALWYTYSAITLWYSYITLDSTTQPKGLEWSVKPISEEVFHIQANYSFLWKDSEYTGVTEFRDDPFRNAWAAEEGIKNYKKFPQHIWFSSQNPKHSSLQKKFPLKEWLSALILWCLLIYFISLKYYVKLVQR